MPANQSNPRVAIIGCGKWGQNLARNFSGLGALAAVAGRTPDTLSDLERRFGVPALSIAEVLGAEDIDGVAISTPAQTHAAIAISALKSGKHVFLEKPAVVNRQELKLLSGICAESAQIFMVGHLLRYHPDFETLLNIVRNGVLGPIRKISVTRTGQGKIRENEGVMMSIGPHALSMVLALTATPPITKHIVTQDLLNLGKEDSAFLYLLFANNISAEITLSRIHPVTRRELIVVGEAGMAIFDELNEHGERLSVQMYSSIRHGVDVRLETDKPTYLESSNTRPLQRQCRHFLKCILTGNAPHTGLPQAQDVLDILLP